MRARISSSLTSGGGAPPMPSSRLQRELSSWSSRVPGVRTTPTTVRGRETARENASDRRQATDLGSTSPNISSARVTTKVEITTVSALFSPIIRTMRDVPSTATAVFTRLLLRSTVARNRSGLSISRATRCAPGLPALTMWASRARERATMAVSEPEKKPDSPRQTQSRPNLHKSAESISLEHLHKPAWHGPS